ncbi:MAG: DUF4145 domain-containing protein [Gemmatimonadetes bacterium]|nr:DUF4145 domain-containing protein [Gemmatimonadota bacterium]
MNDKFLQRFRELQDQSDSIQFELSEDRDLYVPRFIWLSWATSAESLIQAVFGEESPYHTNFASAIKSCNGYEYRVKALQELFLSAKEAFEGGYVFNVELSISGEIFGDFIALAKQSLAEGHKDVAAVLASAALEDALKRYAKVNGLDVDDATMAKVISAIKSKGLVSGASKSMLDAMLRIRNYTMHAEWEKVNEPDVNSIIGFVEQFLLQKFSS